VWVRGSSTPTIRITGEFSPRVSFAWNPHYSDGILGKLLGTARPCSAAEYSRIFGRLNGVDLVWYRCSARPAARRHLRQSAFDLNLRGPGVATPATAFRIGTDGLSAPLQGYAHIPQPYYPAQRLRKASTPSLWTRTSNRTAPTTLTLTIQREINPHVHLRLGISGKS